MQTINIITISADPDEVFNAVSDIAAWARVLPHYRRVTQVGDGKEWKIYEMAAWRSFIPIKWTSITEVDPIGHRIYFKHVGGLTRGMDVVWSMEPVEGGTSVSIKHELAGIKVPIVRSIIGQFVTGEFFIEPVADLTLLYMKRWIEAKCVEQS